MSTSTEEPVSAKYENGRIWMLLTSGLEVSFPVAGNPRLQDQGRSKLNNIELSPFGLHWLDSEEDLSVQGILAGDFGQKRGRAA